MAELLFVRHAETEWSGRRYCGRTDLPLNATGLASAHRLALELATTVSHDAVFVSSPSRRARQTTEILAGGVSGATVRIDERWSEADFGLAEGLTYDELAERSPAIASQLMAGLFAIDWPFGERAETLAARVEAALRDVIGASLPTVVVSHGGPLRIAIGIVSELDPRQVVALEPGHLWRWPAGQVVPGSPGDTGGPA